MGYQVSADTGGTFIDVVIQDVKNEQVIGKALTTHDRVFRGLSEALEAAASEIGSTARDVLRKTDLFIYGTTRATNAIVTRNIAKTALLTTAGFEDVLVLKEGGKQDGYDFTKRYPDPYIPRRHTFGIPERIDSEGVVIDELDEDAVLKTLSAIRNDGFEAVAVSLLWSIVNPAHELRVAELLGKVAPDMPYTLSHRIAPIIREYRRTSAAAIDASLKPLMQKHFLQLEQDLRDFGYQGAILVSTSMGGVMTIEEVIESPIHTARSGPAMAPLAGLNFSLLEDLGGDMIVCDTGGTTFDVGLSRDGAVVHSRDAWIGPQWEGDLLGISSVDIRSIGAGGGSIAWVDSGGLLRVGPQSAGSEPGPICYGRGGSAPTITDANLMLGRLDPAQLSAEPARITLERVRAIFQRRLAEPLGIDVEAAAAAVVRVANTRMAGAVRMVSIARGHDPRDFALFAFGGAGPMHAVALACELGIPEVLVPARPGLTNALGCLVADLRQDFVNTLNVPLEAADMERVRAILTAQRRRGIAINAEEQSEIVETVVLHGADMQFRGQTHLLRVALPNADVSRATLQALFERAYFARFRVELPEIKAVLVNLVTSVIGRRRAFPLRALIETGEHGDSAADALIGERPMFADARWVRARVYDRMKLPAAARVAGPALIQQMDATTVVEPQAIAVVDATGNLRIAVSGRP